MQAVIEVPLEKISEQVLQRPVSQRGIEELSKSITAVGILEPLLVVQEGDSFHLIAGQRRLMAAGLANLPTVPCIVVPADQEKALAMSLHENLFRENLSVVDEANLYAYLRDKLGHSNRAISKMIAKSEPYVSQRLSLLSWDPQLIKGIQEGKLSFSVARTLAQVHDVGHRRYLIQHAIEQGINYRTVESWVRQWKADLVPPAPLADIDNVAPGSGQATHVMSDCFWCEKSIPIESICNIFMCDACFADLKVAKDASRRKPRQPSGKQT